MALMLTFIIVVVLVVGALLVDIGYAFTSRRQMQNAADAAAVAGANVIAKHLWFPTTASPADTTALNRLGKTVETVLMDNGALTSGSDSQYSCTVLTSDFSVPVAYSDLGDCADEAAWASKAQHPIGVRVVANQVNAAFLAGAVGRDTIATKAVAAATVQPVRTGNGAFLVCASQTDGSGVNNATPILVGGKSAAAPYLINPAALPQDDGSGLLVEQAYTIYGSGVDQCGAASAMFRGRNLVSAGVDPTSVTLPRWFDANETSGSGTAELSTVAGQTGCDPTADDIWTTSCVVVAPVCTSSQVSGGKLQLFCVRLAAFRMIPDTDMADYGPDGAPHPSAPDEWNAVLLGGAVLTGGQGSVAEPTPGEPVVVKLVE